jgi:UDPglucose 6-dehydrogenase
MNIGIVGLGKLGTPVALAMTFKGHNVIGYDINPAAMRLDNFPHREIGPNGESSIADLLKGSDLHFGDLPAVVSFSDIIFVAVQTPHDPQFEGATRLPDGTGGF